MYVVTILPSLHRIHSFPVLFQHRDEGKGSHHQCVGCRSLFSSSGIKAPRGSRSPSCAVRLAAKILARRCSGSLGDQQASGIDTLMYQHDGSHHEDRSNRHIKQDEEECTQARDSNGWHARCSWISRFHDLHMHLHTKNERFKVPLAYGWFKYLGLLYTLARCSSGASDSEFGPQTQVQ